MTTPSLIRIPLPETIPGPRVLLRPWRPEDATAFLEAVVESREHLAPWLPWARQYHSVSDVLEFIARKQADWLLREDLALGIFERETGRLLGGTGLHNIDWQIRRFEIGYWIRRTAQGQGYVTESVQLLTRLAFEHLAANRVEIRMDPRNHRSRRVPERLGFVLEGTLRCAAPDGEGRPRDQHVFALIRDDYRRLPWAGPLPL